MVVPKVTAKGAFGAFFPQDMKFIFSKLYFPFGFGFVDFYQFSALVLWLGNKVGRSGRGCRGGATFDLIRRVVAVSCLARTAIGKEKPKGCKGDDRF